MQRCLVLLPFLVILIQKGFEVPHVLDLVDECTVRFFQEFVGKKLIFTTKVMKDLLGHKVARESY